MQDRKLIRDRTKIMTPNDSHLACNMGSVAIKDRGVAGTDLTRVVQDDDLGLERLGALGRVVLGVTGDVAALDVLDGHVLDVEADVVSRVGGLDLESTKS